MKDEYHEGNKAAKRLETLANAVFRAPKTIAKSVPKPEHTAKKASNG